MKTKIFLTTLLWSLVLCQYAQMPVFYYAPRIIEVDFSPCSVSSSLSGPSNYFRSTGILDFLNLSTRFYINDATVYDGPSQTAVGSLPTIPGYDSYSAEIVIIPVPGTCDQFYAFYNLAHGPMDGQAVVYVTIDCSGASVTVSAPTIALTCGGNGSGLAASKKVGSGSSAYYYLYCSYWSASTAANGIYAMKVTSSGVASTTDIGYVSSSLADASIEMELSEDGNWIAFNPGMSINQVFVVNLSSPTTYLSGSEQVYSYTNADGIEFVGSGTPDLYVCGPGYFDQINLSTQTATSKLSGLSPYNLDNTMLEYDVAGQLCGFCDYNGSRWFVEYDPSANTAQGTQVTVNPNSTQSSIQNNYNGTYNGSMYYMPDQIDGEDYQNFSTIPYVHISGLSLNGGGISTECGTWTDVYSCNPINVSTFLEGGGACSSWIDITNYDADCNPQVGTGFFNYTGDCALADDGSWPTRDIRDSYIHHANSLYTKPGYYGVTVHIRDCCGHESSMTFYINVLSAINPAISLETYDYTAPLTYLPYSHSISSPNLVGASSIGYRVSGSTGYVNSMNAVLDEVDNTGAFIQNIFNQTDAVSSLGGLTYIGLNTYCVPGSVWGMTPPTTPCSVGAPSAYSGYKSYFIYNNTAVAGKYYQLTVTLSNPCSSSQEWTYLYVNSAYNRMAPTGIAEQNAESASVSLYPNPATDQININIGTDVPDNFTAELYDITGRKIATLANNVHFDSGEHVLSAETGNIANGAYMWKVYSAKFSKAGLISISR